MCSCRQRSPIANTDTASTTRIRRSPRKHMTTMTGSNGSDTTSSGEGDDTVSGGRK